MISLLTFKKAQNVKLKTTIDALFRLHVWLSLLVFIISKYACGIFHKETDKGKLYFLWSIYDL